MFTAYFTNITIYYISRSSRSASSARVFSASSEEEFSSQFTDMPAPVYTADMEATGTAFDQVTGATVSSKAVANGINVAYDFLNTIQ